MRATFWFARRSSRRDRVGALAPRGHCATDASNVVYVDEVPKSKGIGQWVFVAKKGRRSSDFMSAYRALEGGYGLVSSCKLRMLQALCSHPMP